MKSWLKDLNYFKMAPQVRLGFSNASVSTSISVSFTGSAKKVNLSIGNLELQTTLKDRKQPRQGVRHSEWRARRSGVFCQHSHPDPEFLSLVGLLST